MRVGPVFHARIVVRFGNSFSDRSVRCGTRTFGFEELDGDPWLIEDVDYLDLSLVVPAS